MLLFCNKEIYQKHLVDIYFDSKSISLHCKFFIKIIFNYFVRICFHYPLEDNTKLKIFFLFISDKNYAKSYKNNKSANKNLNILEQGYHLKTLPGKILIKMYLYSLKDNQPYT